MDRECPEKSLARWHTLDSRREFGNRWLSVHVDQVALPDGSRYQYTRLMPGGIGVAVLGFNAEGDLLLEQEYRHGVGEIVWQLPGGLCGDGEDLQSAGLRELLEETGYAPERLDDETVRYLGCVWDNPALGPAASHIYEVHGLVEREAPARNANERLTLHWVTVERVQERVRTGAIRDRVVIAALLQHLLRKST